MLAAIGYAVATTDVVVAAACAAVLLLCLEVLFYQSQY